MGKGPGWLRREILACLNDRPAKVVRDCESWELRLAPGIYDARMISHALAKKHGGISHCHYHSRHGRLGSAGHSAVSNAAGH